MDSLLEHSEFPTPVDGIFDESWIVFINLSVLENLPIGIYCKDIFLESHGCMQMHRVALHTHLRQCGAVVDEGGRVAEPDDEASIWLDILNTMV